MPIRGSNSVDRQTGQRLADGGEDLFVRRKEDQALFGDGLLADQHVKLSEAAFDQFGLDSEFAFQQGRHTDGSRFIRSSGLAVANDDGFHFNSSRRVIFFDAESILRHVVINFIGPGADAAFDALEVLETLLAQELKRSQGTHAALAVKVILLVRIQFGEPLR